MWYLDNNVMMTNWLFNVLIIDQRSLRADKPLLPLLKYGCTVTNNTANKTSQKWHHAVKDSSGDGPEVYPLLKRNSRVVRSDPETVGSNTVNKRMSTSWGMTQPLCPVQNEWHQNTWKPFSDIFTPLRIGYSKLKGWVFYEKLQYGGCFEKKTHQNNKRHSAKEKKHCRAQPVIRHQKHAWQPR